MGNHLVRTLLVWLSLSFALAYAASPACAGPADDLPFAVEISPPEVAFHVDGPPDLNPASAAVTISVRSGFADWTLYLQASPMVEVTSGWVLPASRIVLEGAFEDVMAEDEGVVGLGQPILIAAGEFTGPEFQVEAVLNLRMESKWSDRPGTYEGQVILTFLATP
jgi:hypothetical protein